MNLLYIFADQWRRDALGLYDARVKTPNLDAFAAESVVFDRAYSSCPLCSPHRASLLTGKHPIATNVFTNCKPDVDACLREEEVCISDILKQEGFRTGYIGKWHLDQPDGSGGWDACTPPGKKRHGFDFWYSYGTDGDHMHPHYWNTEGGYIQVNQWSPEHETDVALEFLKENRREPFALFLSYNPPHFPTTSTPARYREQYRGTEPNKEAWAKAPEGVGDPLFMNPDTLSEELLEGYYGAVTGVDENIGRLLTFLKENGLYEETWVVISADHGDMLGEHGLQSKHIWYEGSAAIPFMAGGGGAKPFRTEELIASPDQTVTLLGLLGIPIPGFMQGKDFSPLIRQENHFQGYGSILLAAFPGSGTAIEDLKRRGENFMDYGWRCVVTKKYKLAVVRGQRYGKKPEYYLYDLENDPNENRNLEDEEAFRMMMRELKFWCEETRDGFYNGL